MPKNVDQKRCYTATPKTQTISHLPVSFLCLLASILVSISHEQHCTIDMLKRGTVVSGPCM